MNREEPIFFNGYFRRVLSAALFFAGSMMGAVTEVKHLARTQSGLRLYTNAKAIQQLSVEEALRRHPVSLHGVITYVDEVSGDLFIQDGTAGVYVFLIGAQTKGFLRTGVQVSLTGVTTPGDFSPCVTKADIRVIGVGRLPSAKRFSMDVLQSGKEDGHWAEIEGIVHSAKVNQNRLLLEVSVPGGTVVAVLKTIDPSWASTLVDSEVILRGTVAQMHNKRRQAIGFRLMVPSGYLQIKKAAPVDSFSLPESSTDSVRTYRENPWLQHRIRIRGAILGREPAGNLYIAGTKGNLEVQGASDCTARPGDTVDVLGFPGAIEARPALLNSICREAPGLYRTEPLSRKADQILTARMLTAPLVDDFASGMRDDMNLVRVNGTLVLHSPGTDGEVLLFQSETTQFIATRPYRKSEPVPEFQNGSKLEVTGVCLVTYDQYGRAKSFRVLLRDDADIVILTAAPWWNLHNAFFALMMTVLLLLVAILWVAYQSIKLRHACSSLQRLSSQDSLTGAANRRKFDQTLETACREASQACTPLSLLMLDIDYFKALNDRYGHQRGDECLVQIAGALKSMPLRVPDSIARYGGEEFALILSECCGKDAVAVAEWIRLTVLGLAISNEGSPTRQHVSVSIGVATFWSNSNISPTALVEAADKALYQSKVSGRNCTTCFEPVVDGSSLPLSRNNDIAEHRLCSMNNKAVKYFALTSPPSGRAL